METFSALRAICAGNSPGTGEFPAQRPVTWSFDVFFDLRLNKRLRKQSWGWWFETLSRPLRRHSNDIHVYVIWLRQLDMSRELISDYTRSLKSSQYKRIKDVYNKASPTSYQILRSTAYSKSQQGAMIRHESLSCVRFAELDDLRYTTVCYTNSCIRLSVLYITLNVTLIL